MLKKINKKIILYSMLILLIVYALYWLVDTANKKLEQALKNPGANIVMMYLGFFPKNLDPISSEKEIRDIANSQSSDDTELGRAALGIARSSKPIHGADVLLQKIVNAPKAYTYSNASVVTAIGEATNPIAGADKMLQKIIESKNYDLSTLHSIMLILLRPSRPIEGGDKILLKLIDTVILPSGHLEYAILFVKETERNIEYRDLLIRKIINSPKITGYLLSELSSAIIQAKEPVKDADEIFQHMLRSSLMDEVYLGLIVSHLSKLKASTLDLNEVMQEVLKSDKAGPLTFINFIGIIQYSKDLNIITNSSKTFQQMIDSPRSDARTFSRILDTMEHIKTPILDADKILLKIIYAPKSSSQNMYHIEKLLTNSQFKIENTELIIEEIKKTRIPRN